MEVYVQFRSSATVFIDNIDKVELKATQIAYYSDRVKQYKEEARFFRAYFFSIFSVSTVLFLCQRSWWTFLMWRIRCCRELL